jgi:hypothetical protein
MTTMNWRAKIEQKFEHLADFIFENSKKTILAVLLLKKKVKNFAIILPVEFSLVNHQYISI